MKKLSLAILLAALSQPAFAEEDGTMKSCEPQETASIYTSHVYNGFGFDEAQRMYDADKKKINQIAQDRGVTLVFSNESYSASPGGYEINDRRDFYNVSSNLSYNLKPASKGKELFIALKTAGINVTYNYSKTDNCSQD